MGAKAYLTIDDSPSTRMDDYITLFDRTNIPMMFFLRGDKIEERAGPAIQAAERGLLLGNHGFSHARFSDLSVEEMIEEIRKTEKMIDNLYNMANMGKPGLYFRFPHLDRGCGSWVVDYDEFDLKNKNAVKSVFTEGLNVISGGRPSDAAFEKRNKLQDFLKAEGYSTPFSKATNPWYDQEECQKAQDCLFTYSTADWMVSQRHVGKWRYKSVEDLIDKINHDPYLMDEKHVGVVLAHDQAEIIDTSIELIEYMIRQGMEFLPFDQ